MTALSIPFHPLADLFPLMQGEDFTALVADIRRHGLRESIILYEDKILDGRNRYRACIEAGVDPTYPKRFAGARADAVAFVISANIRRRHLTPIQKRDLIAKLLKASPEKSDRQIAKTVGVDNKTVAAVRSREEIPHVDKRIDSKGRKQPATKPARQLIPARVVQVAAAEPQAVEVDPAPATPLDPLAELQRAWDGAPDEARQEFVAAAANCTELRSRLTIAAKRAADERAQAPPPAAPSAPAPPTSPSDRWADYPEMPAELVRAPKPVH
jgi:ParB-like chromosome segregation protein Spo0J